GRGPQGRTPRFGGRPRPRPAQGLADALPVPHHPPPGHVRPADGAGEARRPVPRPWDFGKLNHRGGRRSHGMTAWRMPAETAPQERIWMAFPTGGYTLGDTPEAAHAARSVWAAVANAAVQFEPVTVMVHPDDVGTAARYLDPAVEVLTGELNDAWMRDIGPSFVLDEDGNLGAVDWIFNGWGAQEWAAWDKDARVASDVAGQSGAVHIVSSLVNEGGGIQVDGQGTVLVTETVQLDPGRNPGISKDDVERELARTIGAT